MNAPDRSAQVDVLAGEGEVRRVIKKRIRRECENCGEPATRRLTFLLNNARRNPASSAYGRDDCSYCSDHDAYACDDCERTVERAAPDGMQWCSTFSAGGRFDHMMLRWIESDETDAVAELVEAANRANTLVRLLTVRQVIKAGDEYIEAAGLNPYCLNEGLAEGDERIGFWRLDAALARIAPNELHDKAAELRGRGE